MTVNLTGPDSCAECGTSITPEAVASGDAGRFHATIQGHQIPVPGLYVCTPCAGAIMVGERETRVTWESALEWLDDTYIPAAARSVARFMDRLNEAREIRDALDVSIALRNSGELDVIPECAGHHEPGRADLN